MASIDRGRAQYPQQLGKIDRHAARLVAGEQLGRRAPTGLVLEIEIAERLPGGVLHDEARIVIFFDRPRWREAAGGGHGAMIARQGGLCFSERGI